MLHWQLIGDGTKMFPVEVHKYSQILPAARQQTHSLLTRL